MKKIIELKTVNKLNFHKPEQFDKKVSRLKAFCSDENTKVVKGQRYYLELYPDHNSATLYLEIDREILKESNY